MKNKSRKKVVVVINKSEKEKDFDFAKLLDEIASFAGPSAMYAGVTDTMEVVALAVFWYVLCKCWAVRIRRNSK